MRQFDNYKKTLEDHLESVEFIYSGDVISSSLLTFAEKRQHSSFSADLFKKIMIDVYDRSVKMMFDKSDELLIHRNNFSDIHDLINTLSFSPKLLFFSYNSDTNLNLGGNNIFNQSEDGHLFLPTYFNRQFKIMSHGIEVSSFFCPVIDDTVDDCHFYLVDKPIQSMVWSLQNIDYNISKSFSKCEHLVKIPIYDCDFRALRVRVVNTQKLREDKINYILNDN